MKRQNKWRTEYIVQGHYGSVYGWEDETAEDTRKARRVLNETPATT